MSAAVYHKRLARVLDRMGGLYTLNDILTAIAEGKMQSFAVNNSWAVTQVEDYPRARKLAVVAMVGDIADVGEIEARILAYADDVSASLVSANGRRGWLEHGLKRGWRLKARNYLFHKDM